PTPAAPAPVEAATPEPKAVEPAAPAEPAKPAESQQAALPPKAEPAPAAAGGGIYIQLGSLTNRDGVPKEWARLQKVFPDFLGDMELAIQTVTLEGRGTFHRIQAGPLPNRGTAEELCAFLKDAKQACIVVKR
ncbi:MAG: SPOR domain-containing protein, partial [Kiloniellales bacterium]|nr:SPOR domain-containing protein [Kiloniellales bacterium]